MNSPCYCGGTKRLHLRTVVYARNVKITGVPVICCQQCGNHEVFEGVKEEVGQLIGRLGPRPEPADISFDEQNEWAGVLQLALKKASEGLLPTEIMRAAEERTNELLDMWLIAASLGDERWKSELQTRLSQLRKVYIS